MKVTTWELEARERLGEPGWVAIRMEHVTPYGVKPGFTKVTGSVYPKKTRGKYKGQPKWSAPKGGKEDVLWFNSDMHEAWVERYEANHGVCTQCDGTGKSLWKSSVKDGRTYRACKKCGGTGKPKARIDDKAQVPAEDA